MKYPINIPTAYNKTGISKGVLDDTFRYIISRITTGSTATGQTTNNEVTPRSTYKNTGKVRKGCSLNIKPAGPTGDSWLMLFPLTNRVLRPFLIPQHYYNVIRNRADIIFMSSTVQTTD